MEKRWLLLVLRSRNNHRCKYDSPAVRRGAFFVTVSCDSDGPKSGPAFAVTRMETGKNQSGAVHRAADAV